MNTDAGMAGEAISVMNVYHSLAASTEHARFHGSATVSKAGVDSSAIKVCYSTHQRYVFYFLPLVNRCMLAPICSVYSV